MRGLRSRPPARRRVGAVQPRGEDELVDARQAILDATERLLEDRGLDALTVVDVIEAAEVSRATFYTYFESKHHAVAQLAEAVLIQLVEDVWRPWIDGAEPDNRALLVEHWRDTLTRWQQHSAVLVAAAQGWRTHAAVYEGWGRTFRGYIDSNRESIERAQAAGAAPADLDAATLAALWIWQTETVLYLTFTGEAPEFADLDRLAHTLAEAWLRLIYGAVPNCSPS